MLAQETSQKESSERSASTEQRLGPNKLSSQQQNQTNSTFYEDYDLKSSRFENLPIGKLTSVNKLASESKGESSGIQSTRESFKRVHKQTKRTTLKEEILLNEQFQNKIPDFYTRKNVDLMRIVEDQVNFDRLMTVTS